MMEARIERIMQWEHLKQEDYNPWGSALSLETAVQQVIALHIGEKDYKNIGPVRRSKRIFTHDYFLNRLNAVTMDSQIEQVGKDTCVAYYNCLVDSNLPRMRRSLEIVNR